MTREECFQAVLDATKTNKCVVALLPTGLGKTKIAINCIDYYSQSHTCSCLLVVEKIVHKTNWLNEIKKWKAFSNVNLKICCYASLKKEVGNTYDFVILDEGHHIGSDSRREYLEEIGVNNNLLVLSATVSKEILWFFKSLYTTKVIRQTTQNAIDEEILPDPKIILMPLILDSTRCTCQIELNKKAKGPIIKDYYTNKWKHKGKHCLLLCTPKQRLSEYDGIIAWYKKKVMGGSSVFKAQWMRACKDRLDFLSDQKTETIKKLISLLQDKRALVFCNGIEQTTNISKNAIHSKNNSYLKILDDFNDKKINLIASCNMLNEGMNLVDCEYGIFANIPASEIMQIQRVGRILRHKNPKIIIPYYMGTREEEIVKDWIKGYNSDLITIETNMHKICSL